MTQNRKTIFAQPKAAPFLALLAAFVWGAAYPFIKLGLGQFAIDNMDTGGKHIKESRGSASSGRAAQVPRSFTDAMWLFAYALINTTLHYFCFYIGVSNSPGSRASILNSLGTFLLVLLSCLLLGEPFLPKYIISAVLVAAGVYIINREK